MSSLDTEKNSSGPCCRSSGLAAAISRGEGELAALRSTLQRVETALAVERNRAAELRSKTCKEVKMEHEIHAQGLLQKLERERKQKRELRASLADAAHQLDASATQVSNLAAALSTSEAALQESQKSNLELEKDLKKSLQRNVTLDVELAACKEALVMGMPRYIQICIYTAALKFAVIFPIFFVLLAGVRRRRTIQHSIQARETLNLTQNHLFTLHGMQLNLTPHHPAELLHD